MLHLLNDWKIYPTNELLIMLSFYSTPHYRVSLESASSRCLTSVGRATLILENLSTDSSRFTIPGQCWGSFSWWLSSVLLDFVRVPPPHDFEHTPTSHALHSQCTRCRWNEIYAFIYCMLANTFVTQYKITFFKDLPGHSSISHSWISVDFPSQTPPLASSINFVLLLSLVLTPQVAEHSPIVQLPHTQWIAVIPRISSFHSYYDCIWFYQWNFYLYINVACQ